MTQKKQKTLTSFALLM